MMTEFSNLKKQLILWITIICGISGTSFSQNLTESGSFAVFESITLKDGLSNLQIKGICQDELGYMWIGTARGLNRYDGQKFEHFLFDPDKENVISHDYINSLRAGEKGIFVSTNKGQHYYNNRLEEMMQINTGQWENNNCSWQGNYYSNYLFEKLSVFDEEMLQFRGLELAEDTFRFHYIFSDSDYGIWILQEDKSIALVNPASGIFSRYVNPKEIGLPANITVYSIKCVRDMLWIGTNQGLFLYDFISNKKIPDEKYGSLWALKNKDIRFLQEDGSGQILIGTYKDGLFTYNPHNDDVNHYVIGDNSGLSSNSLTCCFIDKRQNIWIGTFDKGIIVSYHQRRCFNPEKSILNATDGKFTNCIISDKEESLFFGTRYDGLIVIDRSGERTRHFTKNNSLLSDNHVSALYCDRQGQIWVGQPDKLQIFNPSTSTFRNLNFPSGGGEIVSLTATTDGKVYAGTGSGLLIFDENGIFEKRMMDFGPNVRQIIPFNHNDLLICTFLEGLYIFSPATNKISELSPDKQLKQWKAKEFCTIYVDSDSILWIGNFNWGLIRFDLHNNEINVLNRNNGLPSNDIYGIIEDSAKNLWISTSYGLSCFEKKNNFVNYYINEGINNQQFHQKAVYKDKTGMIYFGGNEGVTHFKPEKILVNELPLTGVVLRSLRINYEPVLPGGSKHLLEKSISYTASLSLNHNQKSFRIDYIAFHYGAESKVEYETMLEGFDEKWQSVGDATYAAYSNLPAGRYTFKVRSCTNNTEWSNPVNLSVRIKHAPWLTWWAFVLYSLVFIMVLLVLFRLMLRAKFYKKNLEVEHNERIREKEVHQMKLRFFANISHELKTPLSIISGLVYMISKQLKRDDKSLEVYASLKYNTERLLKLIHQILNFRELESDTVKIDLIEASVSDEIERIIKGFIHYSNLKKISLTYSKPSDSVSKMIFDPEKLEIILSNLISNSIKYTPQKGFIEVFVNNISTEEAQKNYEKLKEMTFPISQAGYLEISVKDNGSGIDINQLRSIFERYNRTNNKFYSDYSSTGLGLNFSRRLSVLHKGDIRVESQKNFGSVFSFILPLDTGVWTEDEMTGLRKEFVTVIPQINKKEELTDSEETKRAYSIIIVEDNIELNNLIANILSTRYSVISAYNGLEGLKKIKQELPDLIISDVMMPEMSGLELCNNIKNNEVLNHISFILLSARSELENQIEGLKKGADFYISKPFDPDYLIAIVDNLFDRREKMHLLFQQGLFHNLKMNFISHENQSFVNTLNQILERDIENEGLNVEHLSMQMNMSRSNFHRKFLSVTNTTPNAYINTYRVRKAVEIMQQTDCPITEICIKVGVSNPAYFSTMFKKEKGISPSEFIKNLRK